MFACVRAHVCDHSGVMYMKIHMVTGVTASEFKTRYFLCVLSAHFAPFIDRFIYIFDTLCV